MKSSRNDSIDITKFFLASLIIVLHTIQMVCYPNYWTYGFLHLPQRLAVPLFFLISSYYFWANMRKYNYAYKGFLKYMSRWIIAYLFWSFVHLRFYQFNWYYPTAGVLWFFYALILGNAIVFLITRFIKNKDFIYLSIILIWIFMSLVDGWYGLAIKNEILKTLIDGYYNTFKTSLSGFTYGILFSSVAYLIAEREEKRREEKRMESLFMISSIVLSHTNMF